MKKLLLVLAIVGGYASSSFAQSSPAGAAKFSIGFEAGLPTGDIKQATNVVLGGSLKYEVPFATNTLFTISAGYNSFQIKEGLGSFSFIPVKAGIKYYFNEGFYGEGQLGVAFAGKNVSGNGFAYAPGIGYTLDSGLDIGIRYEAWSNDGTISQIGLRLAYRF